MSNRNILPAPEYWLDNRAREGTPRAQAEQMWDSMPQAKRDSVRQAARKKAKVEEARQAAVAAGTATIRQMKPYANHLGDPEAAAAAHASALLAAKDRKSFGRLEFARWTRLGCTVPNCPLAGRARPRSTRARSASPVRRTSTTSHPPRSASADGRPPPPQEILQCLLADDHPDGTKRQNDLAGAGQVCVSEMFGSGARDRDVEVRSCVPLPSLAAHRGGAR